MWGYDVSQLSELSALGVTCDIVGALVIARGLVLQRSNAIRSAASPMWDGNLALPKGLIEQRIDARYGTLLLVIGFVLQLGSALGLTVGWLTFGFGVALLAGIVLLYLLTYKLRVLRQSMIAWKEPKLKLATVRRFFPEIDPAVLKRELIDLDLLEPDAPDK